MGLLIAAVAAAVASLAGMVTLPIGQGVTLLAACMIQGVKESQKHFHGGAAIAVGVVGDLVAGVVSFFAWHTTASLLVETKFIRKLRHGFEKFMMHVPAMGLFAVLYLHGAGASHMGILP
eukprot:CAMPEP_0204108448 /NCGR_PEP_ID=MMETSP0361-20130328/713_1 /ASSEMBLY_ACC=CAM_ASM_000343 /TAXON_ID=268821 /ORGANISM="Scrippsiella Hangoei, Strain SHTV-5" /LENGTH=119 /DNA_ID=CAMNT_0051058063 /DNA_START=54 /DNA_END=409 /DNA_ORIENTATION=+